MPAALVGVGEVEMQLQRAEWRRRSACSGCRRCRTCWTVGPVGMRGWWRPMHARAWPRVVRTGPAESLGMRRVPRPASARANLIGGPHITRAGGEVGMAGKVEAQYGGGTLVARAARHARCGAALRLALARLEPHGPERGGGCRCLSSRNARMARARRGTAIARDLRRGVLPLPITHAKAGADGGCD